MRGPGFVTATNGMDLMVWDSQAAAERGPGAASTGWARTTLRALKAAPARPGEPLVSYVHMASNRLFRFQPGVHEAIAYELVRRHLTAARARGVR